MKQYLIQADSAGKIIGQVEYNPVMVVQYPAVWVGIACFLGGVFLALGISLLWKRYK